MLWVLACGLMLVCVGLTQGGVTPYYSLSVNNHRNQTDQWLVEINVDHEDDEPWNILFKNTKNSTVAKLAPLIIEDNKVTGARKCPPNGYEEMFGLGYYKMYGKNDERQWQEAEDFCHAEGGHLIVIDSEQELFYVKVMAFTHAKDGLRFHVGIHDQYKEGDYVTVLNKTMRSTRYSTWYPKEPNGGTNENCAYFHYNINTHENGVCDMPCTNKYSFICEIEAPK